MEACSDVDDSFVIERGRTLHNVLRSVYQSATVECPERVTEIFPEQIMQMIEHAEDRIRGNLNG